MAEEPTFPPAKATPRTFCVPAAEGQMAEDAWNVIRADATFSTTDRRVQRITYNNWRGVFSSEVGYLENDDVRDWLTFAIFEPAKKQDPWTIEIMILGPNGPEFRKPPIMVGQSDIIEVVDFLPDDA